MVESKIVVSSNKKELYRQLNLQFESLLDGETDTIANLANASSLLYSILPDVNWAGFYLYKQNELIVGPFQGKPACVHIAMGRGVCGTAAQERKTNVVEDVHKFPGHIACDSASNSEIVIPLVKDEKLIGVLDLDSPTVGRFDNEDQTGLEKFAEILLSKTNF